MLDGNTKPAEKKPMLQVCGLWENEDKRGNKYLTGSIGGLKVFIFRNEYKEKGNQPDYKMYFGERPNQGGGNEPLTNLEPVTGGGQSPSDDIPF